MVLSVVGLARLVAMVTSLGCVHPQTPSEKASLSVMVGKGDEGTVRKFDSTLT